MNTLFDHSAAADARRLTVIDGQPYLLDTDFIAFVPYGDASAVRWAAKKYLGQTTPNGEPLWKPAHLQGSKRQTIQVALNERQAVFLAHRAAIRYDKTMAIARISSAFAAYHAQAAAGVTVPLIPRGGVSMPTGVDARLLTIIEAIQAESNAIATMMADRDTLARQIREAEERRDALAAKLPPFLKLAIPAAA